jgi:murein tripeptide amidase MpaA
MMACPASKRADWRTPAEASNYLQTPRYTETRAYFERLDQHSERLKLLEFGASPEGRALYSVVIAANGEFTPELAARSGKPVLLIQACIHPGENEGKDALMALARDWLTKNSDQQALERVILLLIPMFSVDGHERFGPHNRINQNGPEAMGWRATAQNLNLNRDFLKLESPEMQAWQRQFNAWDPDLLVDMHNTDGADYQYHLTYAMEQHDSVPASVRAWQLEVFDKAMVQATERKGWLLTQYFELLAADDPYQGIVVGSSTPRYSIGFGAAANRPALLLETHMLKDFKTRTQVNVDLLRSLISAVSQDPQALKQSNREADLAQSRLAGTRFALSYAIDQSQAESIDFKGIGYSRTLSEISGALWTRYNGKAETRQIPLYRTLKAERTVELPHAYLVPASWSAAIDKLRQHGVHMQALKREHTINEASSYRFEQVSYASQPFEGRVRVQDLKLKAVQEQLSFPAGSMLIVVNQKRAPIIAHLLEPEGPDSLVRMGYGDGFMTRTEYAEPRVLEAKARELLKARPELEKEFLNELAKPEFAASASKRLEFFYARLPHYDVNYLRYPVARLNAEQLRELSSLVE